MKKKALITGITGQDGSYLAEFLLKKGYLVHGIKRKSSTFNTDRIDHIYKDFHERSNFFLHYGDLTDSNSIVNILSKVRPNEIYNLGAQSHVGHSFEIPEYTSEVSGLGTLRVLEAMRFLKLNKTKFYQASTSELFGEKPNKLNSFDENSLMVPQISIWCFQIIFLLDYKVYRKLMVFMHVMEYSLIMKAQEGETFVTRKITMYFAKKILGSKEILYLGNLNRETEGHAKDYTEMQWKILQQSCRRFCNCNW